jgi:hypothetical protein
VFIEGDVPLRGTWVLEVVDGPGVTETDVVAPGEGALANVSLAEGIVGDIVIVDEAGHNTWATCVDKKLLAGGEISVSKPEKRQKNAPAIIARQATIKFNRDNRKPI